MNTLPASCDWVSTLDQANGALNAGTIPLLLPPDIHRAERWAEVMRWYNPAGYPKPTDPDDETVVVSATTAKHLGVVAAAALGRPHCHVDTLTDTKRLPNPGSVLVVVPAADATMSALTPALNSWSKTDTRVGLLTGRDPAGTVFSLAKILATRTSDRAGPHTLDANLLLDGPTGRAQHVPHNGSALRLADALADDWRTVLIDAHGSAAHAWLGTHVLCGLTGHEERTHAGQPVLGGCTASRCKLSPDRVLIPAYPHDIRTTVLGLFVCNAIALGATEQYPSDVALALDALEGYPAAVLGLIRGDADTTSLEPAVAANLLRAGTTLGATSRQLNLGLAYRGHRHATLLLGDPDQTPLPTANTAIPAIEFTELPAQPLITSNGRAVPALITPGRALIAKPDTLARLTNTEAINADLLAQLRTWSARLREADLIEDVLRTVASDPAAAPFHGCLETMQTVRAEATHIVFSTIRHVEGLRKHRTLDLPENPETVLDELAHQWAHAVAALAVNSSSAVFEALSDAVTAHHHRARNAAVGPCDLCGAPRRRDDYVSPLTISNRTEIRCPRCGLASSSPTGGAAVMLETLALIQPGQSADITTIVDLPSATPGVLALQLRPRSASQRAYASHISLLVDGTKTTVTLDIPGDAEPELHRVWALFAWRFQLSFTLKRIPSIAFVTAADMSAAVGKETT